VSVRTFAYECGLAGLRTAAAVLVDPARRFRHPDRRAHPLSGRSRRTLADPTRAPAGHHTVKLLSQNVYDLPDWDAAKQEHAKRQLAHLRKAAPNFTDDVILAQLVKSPKDYERLNPHMVHGAFHGGDRGVAQSGALRPAPGWGAHRMPVAGLYQTGATTHPGGSITGAPGRNAAMVLLHDLGHDPAEVMRPA
jgi:phytoene dehydrogenase-like protein